MSTYPDYNTPIAHSDNLNNYFPALLEALHYSGTWSYFWTIDAADKKQTHWFKTGESIPAIPADAKAVYFGVHPARTDQADLKQKAIFQRSTLATVEAVNALYAEFDQKDSWADLAAVQAHLAAIGAPPPSAIVESGGGWHFYWLLREPWTILNDSERKWLADLQARWVAFVGSDPGAKDLARVLRVPGSLNCKYDPPRPVQLLAFNPRRHYMLAALEALLPELEAEPIPAPEPAQDAPRRRPSNSERIPGLGAVDRAASILRSCKARMVQGNRNSVTFWFACRCNDLSVPAADAERLALDLARPAGLAEHEVLATVRSAYKQTPDPSRAAPPMPGRNADHQAQPLEAPAEPDGDPDLAAGDPDLAQEDLVEDFDQVSLPPEPEAPPEWGSLNVEPELDPVAQKRIRKAMNAKPAECGTWVIRPAWGKPGNVKFQLFCGHCERCENRRASWYQEQVRDLVQSGIGLLWADGLDDHQAQELLQGVKRYYYARWPHLTPAGTYKNAVLVVDTEVLPDARHLATPYGQAEHDATKYETWQRLAKRDPGRRVSGSLIIFTDKPDETETKTGEVFKVAGFCNAKDGQIAEAASAVKKQMGQPTVQDAEAFQAYLETFGNRVLVYLRTHGAHRAYMRQLQARIDRQHLLDLQNNSIGFNLDMELISRVCAENGLQPPPEPATA